jgi:hypothetical protein
LSEKRRAQVYLGTIFISAFAHLFINLTLYPPSLVTLFVLGGATLGCLLTAILLAFGQYWRNLGKDTGRLHKLTFDVKE